MIPVFCRPQPTPRLRHCRTQNWGQPRKHKIYFQKERYRSLKVFNTPTVPLLFACWKKLVDALFLVSFSQSIQREFSLYRSFSEWARPITSGCGDRQHIVNHLNPPACPGPPVLPSPCFALHLLGHFWSRFHGAIQENDQDQLQVFWLKCWC